MRKNVLLKGLSTFKIGGRARYFCVARKREDIVSAIIFAREKKLPFFVLGHGSNILFDDNGFSGVVIKNEIKGIKVFENKNNFLAFVGGGEDWDSLVQKLTSKNIWGLENLSGIPGSVGGSVVQNIGAYGKEIRENVFKVIALDGRSLKIKNFSNKECSFEYRDSFFKSQTGRRFIILEVVYKLFKKDRENLVYRDLSDWFKTRQKINLKPIDVRRAVLEIRKEKLPDWRVLGTAGSFFKNPVLDKNAINRLRSKFPDIPIFKESRKFKVSLAFILDKICGLKGYKKGNVGLYEKQPLALINLKNATSKEVKTFSNEVIDIVKKKTGIRIEREVEWVRDK